jgi:hypothetical protein
VSHRTSQVEASIVLSGEPVKRKSAEPGFMTVAFSGDAADTFTVFTYFGHHHQHAQGTWTAKGDGAFTSAFTIGEEASAFETFAQRGFRNRSANAAQRGTCGSKLQVVAVVFVHPSVIG